MSDVKCLKMMRDNTNWERDTQNGSSDDLLSFHKETKKHKPIASHET